MNKITGFEAGVDSLLGGDDCLEIFEEGTEQRSRVLEESSSPELMSAIRAFAAIWMRTHVKDATEESIAESVRVSSVQEIWDSNDTNSQNSMVSSSYKTSGQGCEYRLTSTILVGEERQPVSISFRPSYGWQ